MFFRARCLARGFLSGLRGFRVFFLIMVCQGIELWFVGWLYFSVYDLRSVRGGKGTSLCLVFSGRHLDDSSKWSFASFVFFWSVDFDL